MTSELVQAVEEDATLCPAEKETAIFFSKDDDRASVYTEEAGLIRRLLHHPRVEVETLRVNGGESLGRKVALSDYEEGSITGVEGSIPITILVLQTSPRATSQHSAVVPEGVLR